jgi:outer membrane lipoprotein-sorting protein
MIRQSISIFFIAVLMLFVPSCRTARHINKAIAPKPPKDTLAVVTPGLSAIDTARLISKAVNKLKDHYINFKTFSAKIKVQYEDSKGQQPDITAVVRIIYDSAIWVSINVPIAFVNYEAFRMLITKDSVILMNKNKKEVQYRSLDYLQDLTEIPFDYRTLQDLMIGNPIFMDSNYVSYRNTDNKVLVSLTGQFFKHLLTLSSDSYLLLHSKLDDVDMNRNRTADITYSDFESNSGFDFSTYREIIVSEKNRLDIRLNFKQYEFNKDLSVSFNVPKNYRRN